MRDAGCPDPAGQLQYYSVSASRQTIMQTALYLFSCAYLHGEAQPAVYADRIVRILHEKTYKKRCPFKQHHPKAAGKSERMKHRKRNPVRLPQP